jgi:hypothetical protein
MEMPRVGRAYIVADPENTVQDEIAVCKGRCWLTTIHYILVEFNVNTGILHAIIRGLISQGALPRLLMDTRMKHHMSVALY